MKNKRQFYFALGVTLLAVCLLPSETFADDFGGDVITSKADDIKNFLFGPILKVAGIFGGAFGLYRAVATSSLGPLTTYGGIGLGANLIKEFIDKVYG